MTSAVVVVDREQGGSYNLSEKGVTMHSLCTLTQVRQICFRSLRKICVLGPEFETDSSEFKKINWKLSP